MFATVHKNKTFALKLVLRGTGLCKKKTLLHSPNELIRMSLSARTYSNSSTCFGAAVKTNDGLILLLFAGVRE